MYYLKDLEEIYGESSLKMKLKNSETKKDWLPYDAYQLDDICTDWLYDEEPVRKTMNRVYLMNNGLNGLWMMKKMEPL